MHSTRYGVWALTVSFAFAGLMAASGMAAASPISDVANGLNDALFGGANLFAAQAILTAAVMMAAGMALAILRLNYVAILIVMLSVLGALTAIGWADPTMLILAGLIVVALSGKRIAELFTGGGGGADAEES